MMSVLFEALGWAGTITFVVAYYGISFGKLKADSLLYQWMNLLGAIAIAFSVFVKQAWPAFALEVVWGGIALVTLVRLVKQRKGRPNTEVGGG